MNLYRIVPDGVTLVGLTTVGVTPARQGKHQSGL